LVKNVQIGTGSTSSANVYEWSGGEIGVVFSTKNEAMTFVNKPGKYTLKITEKNSGCFNVDEVNIVIDTLKPIANAGPDDTLMCNRSQVILDAKLSSAAMSYLWTGGPTGYIIPNATSQRVTTTKTGIYSLLVTNTVNGCF
jgi:PKD repeat protein